MPAGPGICGPGGAQRERQNHAFRALTGQLPYQGSIKLLGQEVRHTRRAAAAGLLGYLPQRGSVGFSIAVRELVVMGRYRHHGLLSAYTSADYALADAALAEMGVAHLAARDFTQLSGGEQQLVWLAQLSLQQARLYLLDEPTQQLDVYYRRQVFDTMQRWTEQHAKTVVCSTHDLDNLVGLKGFILNLSEAEPELRPLSSATVQAARECLEQAPRNAGLNEE